MKEVIVNVTGKEIIMVPAGTFKCYKIEPVSADDKPLLKIMVPCGSGFPKIVYIFLSKLNKIPI